MTEIDLLHEELTRAFDADPWHGPSLVAALSGVSADQAAARPIPGAHSIWEIVLHLAAWTGEVKRRLEGGTPAEPAEGDWPEVGPPSEEGWAEVKFHLSLRHAELLAAVRACPEERLRHPGGSLERDPALGTGVSLGQMLHGLAQHDAYHGGQIALLKKAQGI